MSNVASLTLWQYSSFRRLLYSTLSNDFAQSMALIVVPLIILANGDGPQVAGFATAVITAVGILTQIVSGYIADRSNPAWLIRVSSAAQMLAWGALAGAQACGVNSAVFTTVLASIAAAFSSVTVPSEHTMLQALLPEHLYAKANAVTQGREAAANLLGSPFAGFLFGINHVLSFVAQAVLHAIAALFVPSVKTDRSTFDKHPKEVGKDTLSSEKEDESSASLKAGFIFVWRNVPLRALVTAASIINLPMAMFPIVMMSTYERAQVSSTLIGVFASMMGIGIILGSLVADRILKFLRPVFVSTFAILLLSLSIFATAFVYNHFILSCAVYLCGGLLLPAINSLMGTYTMLITPPTLIGRVVSAAGVPGMILMPLGSFLGGVFVENLGTSVSLQIAGVIGLISIAPLWLSAQSRKLPIMESIKEE